MKFIITTMGWLDLRKKKYIKKKDNRKYVDTTYEDIKVCDELAQKSEELFNKAIKYDVDANNAFYQAEKCETLSKDLSKKSKDLSQKAKLDETKSELYEIKSKELLEKSKELCEQAQYLYKEAELIEKEAKKHSNHAKELYEEAYEDDTLSKKLLYQAKEYDKKALECYKEIEKKIKEYENKSKEYDKMIEKCDDKLKECELYYVENYPAVLPELDETMPINLYEEIIYVNPTTKEIDNTQTTYVTPMYDMYHMQNLDEFYENYPSMGNGGYVEIEFNDMWKNYCKMMNELFCNMSKRY